MKCNGIVAGVDRGIRKKEQWRNQFKMESWWRFSYVFDKKMFFVGCKKWSVSSSWSIIIYPVFLANVPIHENRIDSFPFFIQNETSCWKDYLHVVNFLHSWWIQDSEYFILRKTFFRPIKSFCRRYFKDLALWILLDRINGMASKEEKKW